MSLIKEQSRAFFNSMTSQYHFGISPQGMARALKSVDLYKPSLFILARELIAAAYRRFKQYPRAHQLGCRVSLSYLCEETGLSRSTLQCCIADLERAGLIEHVDTDNRGSFYEVDALAALIAKHAPTRQFTLFDDDEHIEPAEQSIQHPSATEQVNADPAIPQALSERLKQIEAQIAAINSKMEPADSQLSPQQRIASLRQALKKQVSQDNNDEQYRQLARLEAERAQILAHIRSSRHAAADPQRKPIEQQTHNARRQTKPASKALHPKRPARNHVRFLYRKLKEMKVSNPRETAAEVLWDLSFGWHARSEACRDWNAFQALCSALKMIEKGSWRTPSGCQHHAFFERVEACTGGVIFGP